MSFRYGIRLAIFLVVVGLALGSAGYGQAQRAWTHWTNSNGVGGMVLQGDNLWMRVSDALIRYNTADGSYRRFTLEDGVPRTWITPFLADSSGAVWFTGNDRVYRFDGSRWESWTGSDSVRFWGADTSLLDSRGNVWIATATGVAKYDGQRWKVWKKINDDNTMVQVLAEDMLGNIWAGTTTGVYRLENDAWKQFYRTSDLSWGPNCILSLAFDASDRLWVGTPVDVARFDEESWTSWNLDPDLVNRHVQCLLRDHRGNIWAATRGGVSRFDGNTWTNWRAESSMTEFAEYLFEDSNGRIWAGSKTNEWKAGTRGIFCYDGVFWKRWTSENGLAGDWVAGIMEDRQGTVWIGTDKGLSGFRDNRWTTWHWMPDMERPGSILSLFDDGGGRIWAGTDMGISRFDGYRWEMLMAYPGHRFAAGTTAAPFVKNAEGTVWSGLSYWDERDGDSPWTIGGVSRYDNPGWTRFTRRDLKFWPGLTLALMVDRQGYLWAGANTEYDHSGNEGALRFDGETWKTWPCTASENSRSRTVYVFLQSSNGTIWAGTAGGAMSYNGNTWRHYSDADGLFPGTVISLLELENKDILALTEQKGLSRFDGSRWTQVQGLPDSRVTCMLLDRAGKIWVGSASGISRLDGDRWTTWKTGADLGRGGVTTLAVDRNNVIWAGLRPETDSTEVETGGGVARFDQGKWQTWSADDGLPSNTVTCITVDSANDVWVGMSGGVSRFSDRISPVAEATAKPSAPRISSIWPNPFNASVAIRFELPEAGRVNLSIYDITGRKVRELISGRLAAGVHGAVWDGRDEAGRPVASGVYLTRLNLGKTVATGRMVLLK